MRTIEISNFLAQQSAQLQAPPSGGVWRGVGIAPGSEVDACWFGSLKLGVKSILSINAATPTVRACRIALAGNAGSLFNGDLAAAVDGVTAPGEKLVLNLYEDCDELNTPGPRAPYTTRGSLAALPATAATARVLMRLPMSGRTRAVISLAMANPTTTSIGLRGFRANFDVQKGFFVQENPTIINGAVTPATYQFGSAATFATTYQIIYVDNESFDELVVWAWDTAGGGVDFLGEATGERL